MQMMSLNLAARLSHKSRSVILLPNPVNFIYTDIVFMPNINKSSIFFYKDRVLSVNKGHLKPKMVAMNFE